MIAEFLYSYFQDTKDKLKQNFEKKDFTWLNELKKEES